MQKLARALPGPRGRWQYLLPGIVLLLLSTSLLTPAQTRVIRVARVSLVEGEVNVQRAGDKRDQWFEAAANLPLDENDQLYTGNNGRAEVQFTGGNLTRLSRDTNFKITQFNNATMQFALSVGTAHFRIGNLDRRKLQTVDASEADNDQPIYFEVDSPVIAVTLLREGNYRINVADDGTTELIVRQGAAEVFNKELGTIAVKEGRRIIVEGSDPSLYQVKKAEDRDDWDRWNLRRDEELFARADFRSGRYVPPYIPGVYDLDVYGDWYEAPGYGWVWSPRAVATGWAPYRTGSWRWYPSYGWTWIGYEPWGWVPYHYGRWAYWGNRWCWVPRLSIGLGFGWSWSPALVVFYGSRGSYGRGYRDGLADGYRRGYRDGAYDWIGWVPLAPGERDHRSVVAGTDPVVISRPGDLRNYNVPGGVSGVEGRHFDNSRIAVREVTAEPSRSGAAARDREVVALKPEDVKPREFEAPRVVQIGRTSTGRDLGGPVVTRRTPTATASGFAEGGVAEPRPNRADEVSRPERGGPARSASENPVSPNALDGVSRPSRIPSFSPAEKPIPPVRGETRVLRPESEPAGGVSAPRNQQSYPAPSRRESAPDGDSQRRMESPPVERPSRVERSTPSRSEEPRRIERQESSRPSSPPPQKSESAPRPERSQPAPAQEKSRESAPSRPGRP